MACPTWPRRKVLLSASTNTGAKANDARMRAPCRASTRMSAAPSAAPSTTNRSDSALRSCGVSISTVVSPMTRQFLRAMISTTILRAVSTLTGASNAAEAGLSAAWIFCRETVTNSGTGFFGGG